MVNLTPKDIAAETFVSEKAVRNQMRKMTDKLSQPGSGGRWEIEAGSDFHLALVKRLTNRTNRTIVVADFAESENAD